VPEYHNVTRSATGFLARSARPGEGMSLLAIRASRGSTLCVDLAGILDPDRPLASERLRVLTRSGSPRDLPLVHWSWPIALSERHGFMVASESGPPESLDALDTPPLLRRDRGAQGLDNMLLILVGQLREQGQ
jgi:hypothetical protein